jgi:hypothetical protein
MMEEGSMPILGTPQRTQPRAQDVRRPNDAWAILSWVAFAFLIMSGTDIALAWYPASFGNPEWEFGAISATLNGFALPTLALYLILASAIARGRLVLTRVLAVVLGLLTIAIGFLGLVYATVIPEALNSVSKNELLTTGMRKAVVKALVLLLAYVILFGAAGVRGWRLSRTVSTE